MSGPDRTIWRDDLAIAMIAAWCNVPVDKMPPSMKAHTCKATAEAWGRVADAAREVIGDPRAMVAAALERAAQGADSFGTFGKDRPDYAVGYRHAARDIRDAISALIDTDHAAALEALVQERAGALVASDHPDDEAVNRFSAAMKQKLKWEREVRGRSGWDDPDVCSTEYLAQLLVEHLAKGNAGTFEDVANFAMMLHQRGANPSELAEANRRQLSEAEARGYQRGQEDERDHVYRLYDGLEAIAQYGADTISGPTAPQKADEKWFSDAVIEMRQRAARLMWGNTWDEPIDEYSDRWGDIIKAAIRARGGDSDG